MGPRAPVAAVASNRPVRHLPAKPKVKPKPDAALADQPEGDQPDKHPPVEDPASRTPRSLRRRMVNKHSPRPRTIPPVSAA